MLLDLVFVVGPSCILATLLAGRLALLLHSQRTRGERVVDAVRRLHVVDIQPPPLMILAAMVLMLSLPMAAMVVAQILEVLELR